MRSIRQVGSKVHCRHKRTKTTTSAGMSRTVCLVCGSVTVAFVEDVFAEEQEQLDQFGDPPPAESEALRPLDD